MSELVVEGVRLTLTGPETLPLAAVHPDSPAYDPSRAFFTVALRNESRRRRILPFDELRRNVVLVYRDRSTGAEFVDNRTPPPRRNGAVEELPVGGDKSFQVVFAYPETIARLEDGAAALQFCVRWDRDWLRADEYAPGAYDWNETFELCRELRVVDEQAT